MKSLKVALSVFFLILSSCATIPKQPISPSDLADLKGKWAGTRDLTLDKERTKAYAEIEIFNDTLPLKGKVTIITYFTFAGVDTRIYPFENGVINQQGNLAIKLTDEVALDLSLYGGKGKMKLQGSYTLRANQGIIVLNKK